MPIAFAAAARSFAAKRCCISGSPPLRVKPPAMTFRPVAVLPNSSAARARVTGSPLLIVQVSGLWQYRQRHMQPVVHATTRTPGPSTAEPVVKECRKPMSPVASAVRTSAREHPAEVDPELEGLFASRARLGGGDAHAGYAPWKVRLITSICCSRVSRTKFTA
jgi:hypothetical protein